MSIYALGLIAVCLIIVVHKIIRRNALSGLSFPPGPKPLPLIGNLLDMPLDEPWLTYEKWFKEFQSDIVYLNVAGLPVVILNTYEAAVELLERRSMLYSSRIRLPMVNELMGWEFSFSLMPYGDEWRTHRRVFQQAFNTTAAKQFEPQETKSARDLLLRLIDRPSGDITSDLRYVAGEMILSITYGLDMLPENDPRIALAEATVQTLAEAQVPGAFWVDMLPWLKYVPSWFPGAGFKRKAKTWSELRRSMVEPPFNALKEKMQEGFFRPSFSSSSLEKMRQDGPCGEREEGIVRDIAGTMYVAGTDTTVSTLLTLILGILRHPEIQRKAQAELDRVLNGAFPTFKDQDSLPYVTAIVKEAFRWNNALPFGIPHCSTSDDVYKGYLIPKGTMVLANIWSILNDEGMYPDPYTFNPDRFLLNGQLNPAIRDPGTACFGFGRRICPGRFMGYSFVWITTASMLATMNITKAVDQDGKVIEPTWEYETNFLHIAKRFPCSIKPRSAEAEALIRFAVPGQEL